MFIRRHVNIRNSQKHGLSKYSEFSENLKCEYMAHQLFLEISLHFLKSNCRRIYARFEASKMI